MIPSLYYHDNKENHNLNIVPDNIKKIISRVVNHYGNYSANRIVSLTHSEGTPWKTVYRKGEKIEIPKQLIQSYYSPIIKGLAYMGSSGLMDELART